MRILIPLWILALAISACTDRGRELFAPDQADWEAHGAAQWDFRDGLLQGRADSAEGFVMTRERYTDFRLELEFMPDSTINSGIFIRCAKQELSATDCHEINIWDLHPNPEFRTGAIVTRQPPMAHVNTLNRWNTYRIDCRPDTLKIWVNDTLTARLANPGLGPGYIGLQASGTGTIRFRNIRLYP